MWKQLRDFPIAHQVCQRSCRYGVEVSAKSSRLTTLSHSPYCLIPHSSTQFLHFTEDCSRWDHLCQTSYLDLNSEGAEATESGKATREGATSPGHGHCQRSGGLNPKLGPNPSDIFKVPKKFEGRGFFSDFCDSFVTDVDCSHESPMEPECAEGAVDVVGFISMLK
jgi:hypothetical protein